MPRHALAILAGTLIALYGNQLPDRMWAAYLPLLLLLIRFCPSCRFLLLAAAAYLWSVAWFHYHLDHRLIEAYDNRVVLLRGIVADIPEIAPGRIGFELEKLEIDGYPGSLPRRIRLSWYRDGDAPLPGEYWQFAVKLRQPRGTLNPGGFDYAAWLFAHGIDASGYVKDSPANRRLESSAPWNLERWRMRLSAVIDAHCAGCERIGLVKALALGIRAEITPSQRRILQSSSTAHLLAISGLHVGMVAVLAFAAGGLVWRLGLCRAGLCRPRLAAISAMLAATAYASMAGFSLPTVRSLVMLLAVLLALLLKNRVNLLQSLCMAVCIIILADPRAPATSSFWLSIGALLVIAFAQFRFPANQPWWRQLLHLQLLFTLLFAPAGMMIFGQLTPAGLPANLAAIPAVSFLLLPAVLAGSLLAAAGVPGAGWLLRAADLGLGWLLAFLDWLVAQGFGALAVYYPALLLLVLLAVLLWLLLPGVLPGRRGALLAAVLLLGWQPARPGHGEFELRILDVGMGTSAWLRTRHHSLVYDLGPGRPQAYSAARQALLPVMRRYRAAAPDLVVVSHVDQDHSGGLPDFLESFPRSRLLSGTPGAVAARFDLPVAPASCHQRPPWRWDGVEFRFLAATAGEDSNNRSCVLKIEGFHRVLLPGDIETRRELALVAEYGDALSAEVLLAPHHGSATSSGGEFLGRVNPRYAVFTLARGNRWDFPSPAVLERYRRREIRLLDSARHGAVAVYSGSRELRIEAQRGVSGRIWRRW